LAQAAPSDNAGSAALTLRDHKLLVCSCEGTMRLDGGRLARACGIGSLDVARQLCRAEIARFGRALEDGRPVMVACTQEAPLFRETALEAGADSPLAFVDIRERAGWSDEGAAAIPKIAALLAEATVEIPAAGTVSLSSEGRCVVYGRDEAALEAARRLAPKLAVTVLLTRPGAVLPPRVMDVPVFKGTIVAAEGRLGAFALRIDDHAPSVVSSRAALAFEPPRDGVPLACDLILDLSGGTPLFAAHRGRDGYLRPDPGDPAAIGRALLDLVDLVGEFEKPRYVAFEAGLCAHSRSRRVGCTRCLEVCPADAIRPAGDVVAIDPFVCGGCGACNSVCPTGAAAYTHPPDRALLERLRVLLSTYRSAGGTSPVLLVHDTREGDEAIALIARLGRGLPARVLPFAVNEVAQLGLAVLAGALAYGASEVRILVPAARAGETAGLAGQIGVLETACRALGHGEGRVATLDERDPEAIEALLWDLPERPPPTPGSYLPMGDRRALLGLAFRHLHEVAPEPVEVVPLPEGSPFGRTIIDVDGCTLCLACVGACPTGALSDNPEKPELRFREEACVQCGLCVTTCPERVVALEPRLAFGEAAREAVVVKSEEPFACIECGKPFGTRASIERIVARLRDQHWMFPDEAALDRLRMCDDCRVVDQLRSGQDPLAGPPRPAIRRTEDDLREREIEEARARLRAERGEGKT
jgi:ferredoxin